MLLCAAGIVSAQAASPTLYVYSGDMDGARTRGMHTTTLDGEELQLKWRDGLSYGESSSPTAFNMESGWIRNGRLCGFMINYPSVSASGNLYVERDLYTGEVLDKYVVEASDTNWTNLFLIATYCPLDDMVYGFGLNSGKTGFAFKRAPAGNLNQAEEISAMAPMLNGICYNSDLGILVGVRCTKNGDYYTPTLVEINPNTGKETKIMTLEGDTQIDYPCPMGIVYVPSMKKYVWNLYSYQNQAGNLSTLVAVDAQRKECETLAYYPAGYCFNYIIADGDQGYANGKVPAAPAALAISKDVEASTVTVSFTMPTTTADGAALSGTLNYGVYEGNTKLTGGTAAAGESVTTPALSISGEGIHYLRVVAENTTGTGVAALQAVYMGDEAPCQVENLRLTDTTLTWDAVTKGVYGGSLSDVMYDVYINDINVGEITGTSVDVTPYINKNGALKAYRAEITPFANNQPGVTTTSNKVVVGTPYRLPYTVKPTLADYDLCQMQDVDGDGVNWSAYTDTDTNIPYLLSGYNNINPTEDWLFLPPVKAEKGIVSVSLLARMAQDGLKLGEISLYAGNAPTKDAMNIHIMDKFNLATTDELTLKGDFKLDTATEPLYIGICVRSQYNSLSPVTVRDVQIAQEATTLSVAEAPEVLSVINDADGRQLEIKLPAKNLDGTDITASEVSVLVESNRRTTTVKGAPGTVATAKISTPNAETFVALTPMVAGVRGMMANYIVKIGTGRPGKICNVRVRPDETNTALTIEWDAPQTNAAGQPVGEGRYSYKLWQVNASAQYELAVDIPFPLTYANMTMSENTNLTTIQIGITAHSEEGDGDMYNELLMVGQPLSMPLSEDFNGDAYAHEPFVAFKGGEYPDIEYKWGNPSKIGLSKEICAANVGDVFVGMPLAAGAKSKIWIPKFSTSGTMAAQVMLDIWTGTNAAKTVVKATGYGVDEEMTVLEVPAGAGYQSVVTTLPAALQDLEWVALTIYSDYAAITDRMVLAGYKVGKNLSSAVDTISADAVVESVRGGIRIANYTGVADVYAVNGVKVAALAVEGEATLTAAPGLYVVALADGTHKVVVL